MNDRLMMEHTDAIKESVARHVCILRHSPRQQLKRLDGHGGDLAAVAQVAEATRWAKQSNVHVHYPARSRAGLFSSCQILGDCCGAACESVNFPNGRQTWQVCRIVIDSLDETSETIHGVISTPEVTIIEVFQSWPQTGSGMDYKSGPLGRCFLERGRGGERSH